jgi:hypothetical protein
MIMNNARAGQITQAIGQAQLANPNFFALNHQLATQGKNVNLSYQTGEAIWSRLNLKNAQVSRNFERGDGVFLWMILINANTGQVSIRFVNTNPYFEFGSKHFMLKNRSPGMVVLGAGEAQILHGVITVNLLSGTYQAPILAYMQANGMTPQEIHAYYQKIIREAWGAPDATLLNPYTIPIVDNILIQHFTKNNLNREGIPHQDIKYSTTRWLKALVGGQPAWTWGEMGPKIGKKSFQGIVFKLSNHPGLIVKISLLPFKTNGQPATEFHTNEVRGYRKALSVGATAIEIRSDFMLQGPIDPRFGEIYQLYQPGTAPVLSVIVMTNFFWPRQNYTSVGDLFDLANMNPGIIPDICKQVRQKLKALHRQGKTRHGDIHPGNILFRKAAGQPYEISLIDFGASLKDESLTNEPIITRGPRYTNQYTNMFTGNSFVRSAYGNNNVQGGIYRVPNAWYLEHVYNR